MVIIRFTIALLLLLAPALSWPASAAEITARADRSPVTLGESFSLIFEAQGSVDDDPDFSPLERDFEILGQNQSSNISIINGQMSRQKNWVVTLMARRSGIFTIPSISFGSDSSGAVHLTVREAPAAARPDGGELFLEVEAGPEKVYVQQQVLFTVRLFHRVEIGNASLSDPELTGSEAIVEKLGDDSAYETTRNGKRYRVVERRYAIFPQQSGPISIVPVRFEGQVAASARTRFGLFDQRMQIRRVQSPEIELSVLPEQAASSPNWLPATGVKLIEQWPEDAPTFKVGEPVTRTLTLAAEGLTAAQLPKIESPLPEGIKGYPDQPVLENRTGSSGLTGLRQEKTALIPTRAGKLTLPAIEVNWWNTAAGRMETARIDERIIEVQPAAEAAAPPPPPKAPAPSLPTASSPSPAGPPAAETVQPSGFWPWLCLGIAIGWAATLIAWWRSRRPPQAKSASAELQQNQPSEKNAVRKIKEGCANRDPQAVKKGLLEWAGICWGENPPGSLGEVSRRCEEPLAAEVERLNQALYGQHRGDWLGSDLWSAFDKRPKPGRKKTLEDETLEPLYRN